MAVGFFVNDDDENNNSSYYTSVTNSATQTPLQSPVSREFLVQVFCEALNRCSIQSSPNILTSPPSSPSCSHPNGDVFFPRSNSTPNGSTSSGSTIQPETPTNIRMHDDYRSAQWSPRATVPRRRYRLNSASDEDDFEDDISPLYDDFELHMHYMAERERLQEFPGRIPPRKKRSNNPNAQTRKTKEQKIWPAVAVTTVALAVGFGFLVTR